ncbi:MAG: hemolysin family protein [Myxococcaceae bacterium]
MPGELVIVSEVLIIFALVLANGVLAGAEIAIVTLRPTRLRELVKEGNRKAHAVNELRERPELFLATVQVGITVVGATAGAFGGATFARDLQPFLSRLPWVGAYSGELAVVLVVMVVSYLSLVFGELVPKSLALRSPERYARLVGRPLRFLSSAARPLVWLLTASSNAVLKIFGDRTSFTESRISAAEIVQLVEAAGEAGTVHPGAGQIASRALEFSELTASEVMIPRGQVVSVPTNASAEETVRVFLEKGHRRLPVYKESPDQVVGYLSERDVLSLPWKQKTFAMPELLRQPYFVPEAMKAMDLLQELRRRHLPLAVVVDERGGMAGILPLEDLLEELVGELFSEHAGHVPERFRREEDGSIVVAGATPIREANRELGLALPEGDDWTTVAGLCLALVGRIPEKGERLTLDDGTVLEIVDASPRRVRAVRIRPA